MNWFTYPNLYRGGKMKSLITTKPSVVKRPFFLSGWLANWTAQKRDKTQEKTTTRLARQWLVAWFLSLYLWCCSRPPSSLDGRPPAYYVIDLAPQNNWIHSRVWSWILVGLGVPWRRFSSRLPRPAAPPLRFWRPAPPQPLNLYMFSEPLIKKASFFTAG